MARVNAYAYEGGSGPKTLYVNSNTAINDAKNVANNVSNLSGKLDSTLSKISDITSGLKDFSAGLDITLNDINNARNNMQNSGTSTTSVTSTPVPTQTVQETNSYDAMKEYMDRMYEEQRRQQEAAYQNTLSQLASSYNRGTENVNQSSDDALRQAYINYMMGKRNINQSLANNGITGGATESILSQLFNNYGTNRANIDKQRVNELADLAARYNQSVAEAGNNYGGDYTDLLNNYYASLVDLEKDRQDRIDRTINNATNLAYRTTNTANSGANDDVLASLINGTNRNTNLNDEYEDETTSGGNTYEANITQAQRDAIVNRLRQIYGTSANYDEDTRMNYVARTMQDLAAQYGLTDAQARAILADAEKGFH